MSLSAEQIIKSISEQVLIKETDVDSSLYEQRLRLLYLVILDEMISDTNKDKLSVLVENISSFEQSQIYSTEISIKQYSSITPTIAFNIFSKTAFSLAIERLKGNDYHDLAEMLLAVYRGLIEYTDMKFDEMDISETLLDFDFAKGNSMIMSLRLKRQYDAMN